MSSQSTAAPDGPIRVNVRGRGHYWPSFAALRRLLSPGKPNGVDVLIGRDRYPDEIHEVSGKKVPAGRQRVMFSIGHTHQRARQSLVGTQSLCSGCGDYFNGVNVFDRHRVGDFEERGTNRRCLTPNEMLERGWWRNKKRFWVRPKKNTRSGLGPAT